MAVDQFYARVLSIESKLLENDQLIGEKERAIACLLGVFPFEIRRMGFDELRKLPVPLSEGIPANLLTLRPDVRSAEMELIASKADVIAAKAAFYPSLVLGASGGFNAFDVGKWFHSPASLVYDLAAGITAPIFRRNEIRSMWNEAKASQRIALSQYHETALNAYTEVLDLYWRQPDPNGAYPLERERIPCPPTFRGECRRDVPIKLYRFLGGSFRRGALSG